MNRHKISPNAIVVALFGLAISGYVAIAHTSIFGFVILILLTIVAAVLVNRVKNSDQE
ncbi:putative secreted protein [Corynebacterium pilosum]|uniref:Putative secreted protein n=1 Tax=Corynebacterium pilosum TaxID=35756 RepID=A0A376CNS1_9CORY|nr:putative secreted protein [Corynebacterium pilosum]